jgi:hypothetical protein
MSAYNGEGALARLPRSLYSRGGDEARALLREAFTLSGDLQITGNSLHVRLEPASAPDAARLWPHSASNSPTPRLATRHRPDPRL